MKTHALWLVVFAILLPVSGLAQDDPAADARRVREIRAKHDRGESLSADEWAFVRKMIARRRAAQQDGGAGRSKDAAPGDWRGLVPLTELKGSYRGEDGGLYGQGRNEPPAAQRAAYEKASAQIQPLDASGRPDARGKIGLITIGFSNTNLESIQFKAAADADPRKSPQVVIVNGAIGGRSAVMWAYDGAEILPAAEQQRLDQEMDVAGMPKANRRGRSAVRGKDTWPTLAERIEQAGLAPQQVQALWLKHVEAGPGKLGQFPAHARTLQADMADVLIIARRRFLNLRVAWLSSRTYAGWAGPNCGSPEPFAYETAFAVRWLIQSQMQGEGRLNSDPARGPVMAPVLIWGPYLWACGDTPRKLDGLVWSQEDVAADHMHPSGSGCKKVAAMLLKFLTGDPAASRWFAKP